MNRSLWIGLILLVAILLLLWASPLINYVKTNQKDLRDLNARTIEQRGTRALDKPRVVVTLTTIPDRMSNLKYAVRSLMDQTVVADEIALNLPHKTLKGLEYEIPDWLKEIPESVRIHRFEPDMGPASKLLPTLRREWDHPETKIIVADDDYVYAPDHIERLLRESEAYPDCAITAFSKNFNGTRTRPPTGGQLWAFSRAQSHRVCDQVLGCFGFLVKPRFFTEDVFDYTDAPPEAIWVDDIWFSGHLLLNDIEIRSPPFRFKSLAMPVIRQLSTPGLSRGTNKGGSNDNIVIEYFWNLKLWRDERHPGLSPEAREEYRVIREQRREKRRLREMQKEPPSEPDTPEASEDPVYPESEPEEQSTPEDPSEAGDLD